MFLKAPSAHAGDSQAQRKTKERHGVLTYGINLLNFPPSTAGQEQPKKARPWLHDGVNWRGKWHPWTLERGFQKLQGYVVASIIFCFCFCFFLSRWLCELSGNCLRRTAGGLVITDDGRTPLFASVWPKQLPTIYEQGGVFEMTHGKMNRSYHASNLL